MANTHLHMDIHTPALTSSFVSHTLP